MIVDNSKSRAIGEAIRWRRKQLGISQATLAALASCSLPSVVAAENGKPTLRLDKLFAMLEALGLTLVVMDLPRELEP